MRAGSLIRAVATRHIWIQLTATAFFISNLLVRFPHRHVQHGKVLWIVLDVIGLGTVIAGGDVGANMVFKMGYRVGPGQEEQAPAPAGGEAAEPELTRSP